MALTKGPTSKDPFLRQGDRELHCECIRNSRKARPAFTAFGGEYRLPGQRFSGRSMLRPYGTVLLRNAYGSCRAPEFCRGNEIKSKEPARTPALRKTSRGAQNLPGPGLSGILLRRGAFSTLARLQKAVRARATFQCKMGT